MTESLRPSQRPQRNRTRPPKRVFVLGTGRCGTFTFTRACEHITNFSVGHETRVEAFGPSRFEYPMRHIEVDNKLSWFLGQLGVRYPDAYYVHLRRDREATAQSFLRRWPYGVIGGFAGRMVPGGPWTDEERIEMCRFYVDTVNSNVEAFTRDKTNTMRIDLEELDAQFPGFWRWICADGDLDAAIQDCRAAHNASGAAIEDRLPSRADSIRRRLRQIVAGDR
jgi:hypothetical protein